MKTLQPVLEDRLFEISIGVLLGDASIQKNTYILTCKDIIKTVEKWRLKFSQSAKHKQYIYHLHDQFKEHVISQPFFNETRNMHS